MTEEKNKTDWGTVAGLAAGVGALGLGAWLMSRKTGAHPGDEITAKFNSEYYGKGGIYTIQVSLGNILVSNWFDHVEGLTWSKNITIPTPAQLPVKVSEDLLFTLPLATKAQAYDAECLIRTPAMSEFDYLAKVLISKALKVVEVK